VRFVFLTEVVFFSSKSWNFSPHDSFCTDCIAWYLFQRKFICEGEEVEEVSGVRFVSIFCMWEIYSQFFASFWSGSWIRDAVVSAVEFVFIPQYLNLTLT
jgi:hypothetical protein